MARVADLGGVSPALSGYVASLRCAAPSDDGVGVPRPNEKRAHREFDVEKTARGGVEGYRGFTFVIYDLRHTCITRWAKVLPLPVVQKLAGHTSISTTMRYVHLTDADVLAAMTKAKEGKSGHTSGHTGQNATRQAPPGRLQALDC